MTTEQLFKPQAVTRELFPHQLDAVDMLRDSMRRGHRRIMLAAATAFGKTTVASYLIQKAVQKGHKCAFIVDRKELLDQSAARFIEDGLDVGIIQGQHEMTDYSKPVQVCTIQTLARRKMQDFGLVIIDEAHTLYGAHKKYMIEYAENANNVPIIGLSASPFTKGLGKWFSDMVVPITTGELIEQGYLCRYEVYAPTVPDLKNLKTKVVQGERDYDPDQLSERMSKPKLVGDIVRTHQELAKGRPTVVFAVDIKHSKYIVEEFKKIGLRAAHLDCYTDTGMREMINEQMKAGQIDVVSCVSILEKGWDCPIASCAILAAPTKSLMRYVQQMGRILRTHPGKDFSIVLDHSGNTDKHGWIEDVVPIRMCSGEKGDKAEVKTTPKEKKPQECSKCLRKKKEFICEHCGHRPEFIKNVELVDGALEKKAKKSKASQEEKEQFHAMLLHYAREKGKKDGWAYFKTVQKFGEYTSPRSPVEPVPPDETTKKYIKYLHIRNAYAQKKARSR